MTRSIALLFVVVMVSSVALTPVGAGGGSASAEQSTTAPLPEPPDDDLDPDEYSHDGATDASIDDDIDRTGTVELVVRFQDADLRRDRQATTALKAHAADTQSAFDQFAVAHDGVTIERDFWIANAKLVRVDTDRVSLDALAGVAHVTRLHENVRVTASSTRTAGGVSADTGPSARHDTGPAVGGATPSESPTASATLSNGADGTYGLDMINASEVWETYDQRGGSATVAVLDSGVNTTAHPELAPTHWAEFDADGSRAGTTPNDGHGHGTHVSGTVVGNTTDSGAHYGVAPNATLLHGKVLNDEGSGTFASILAGMEWAITNETTPDVISLSLGTSNDTRFVEPVQNARQTDIVVVAATGNTGEDTVNDPAAVYDVLSVGAVDANRDVASFSNGKLVDSSSRWGRYQRAHWPDTYYAPDVAAPGVGVLSADASGGFKSLDGTSMAAPHVAGVAALIRSEHPTISEAGVRERLSATAEHPDGPDADDNRYGEGIINASAAVESRDATIDGTVTVGGTAEPNATVTAASGYTTTTNATGAYELAVPSGEVNVSIDPFGWAAQTASTTVSSGANATLDLSTANRTVEVELVDAPAHYGRPSENQTLTYRTANVETYNATLAIDAEASYESGTLYVEGQPVSNGQDVTLSGGPDERVNVTFDPGSRFYGTVGVDHNFTNGTVRQTATTPTRIHPDPVIVPQDPDTDGLQGVLDFVEPYTTIQVDSSSRIVRDAEALTLGPDNAGDPITTGYYMGTPVTLEMAAGSAPIEFQNSTSNTTYGIFVPSGVQNGTVRDLRIDGGGVHTGIVNRQSEARVQNTTIENATVGIEQSSPMAATAISSNTIDHVSDIGILVEGDADAIDGNAIGATTEPVYGIAAESGSIQSIDDNTVTAGESAIILSGSSTASVDRIAANTVTGQSGSGISASNGYVDTIRDNDVSDSSTGIFGATVETVSNNSVSNSSDGIFVTDDQVELASNSITESNYGLLAFEANHSTIDGTTVTDSNYSISVGSAENVSVSNVNVNRSRLVGLWLSDTDGVAVESATLVRNGLFVSAGSNLTVSNLTVEDAMLGIEVDDGSWGPSTNVTVENVTITNTTQEVALRNGTQATVSNVTVTQPSFANETVVFDDVSADAVAVENLTLATGTTLSASGQNSSLGEGSDPGDHPSNLTDVGPTLNLSRAGSSPAMDLQVEQNKSELQSVQNDTLAFYRYDGSQWTTAGTSTLDGTTLNTTGIGSFSQFSAFAESATTNFTVSNLSANGSVSQTDRIETSATITNDGSANGTQTVAYTFDGQVRNSTTVTLATGERTTVRLNWTVPVGVVAGEYTHGIETGNDSQMATVNVTADTGQIDGTITATETGSGLDNATVTASWNGTAVNATSTNATGAYSLDVPTADDYTVSVDHPDYESTQTTGVAVTENATTTADITVDPLPGRIEGTITDDVTGDVVANANVTAYDGVTVVNSTTNDASGYGLDVPAGAYNLTVDHPDFEETTVSSVTVGANETVTIDKALVPLPGAVDWTVTSNRTGAALANTTVTLSNGTTVNQTTAANGSFDPVSRATNYTLAFANADYVDANRTIDVGPNETVAVTERLDPLDGTVTGTVTDTDGATVENATITVEGTNLSTETDANGSYTLTGVPAERSLTVDATARAYNENTTSVNLSANGTTTANLTLTQRDRYFGVDSIAAGDVTAGDAVTATSTVTNLGAQNWSSTLELRVDGTTEATTNLTLTAGVNESVDLSTTLADSGTYTLTVATANESLNTTVSAESAGSGSFGSTIDIGDEETTTTSSGTVQTPIEETTTAAPTTETTTEVATSSPTATTQTPTPTPTATGGPGFGGAVALVAVLAAAALLARRR
ncbi:S8 family serine peptidase [Halococcoides cellulosivorans]|uniref:Uncharacterized protein n=1 Tax=Halococcoides cellulosivorans TaxID=1679096 RepID=A0A2R4WZG2_9EURY|nr:S8 family serine peptidase [Halococcoides cellulosivorans]AWB26927.1 hypothetical protein HARCEL1_03970 [Halococcoides cellulosivorans]